MTASTNPLHGMEPSGPENDGWAPPLPLDAADLPAFPIDCLSPWLAAFCQAVSRAVQVPLDLVATLVLAAVSATVARKIVIEVKADYQEPLNLWFNAPMDSGNRKSSTVRAVVQPIREWEATQAEHLRDKIAEEQSRARIKVQQLAKAEARAAKEEDLNERLRAEAEALGLAAQVGRSVVTATPRILAGDVTAEGLVTLMTEQDGRAAIIVAEGDIFDLMAGRYNNNIPNIGHYLNAHVGDDIDVDRQGRPHQYISHPALTQGISPQPSVLHGLTDKPGFLGRGLLFRYLYAMPRSWVGCRDNHTQALSPDEKAAYQKQMLCLLDIPMPSQSAAAYQPHVLFLDEDASARHAAFEDAIEPRLGGDGDLYAIQGWGSKLAGAVARLAGVLHMARYGPDGLDRPVSGETMAAAITLGHYFIPHTKAAFTVMGADHRLAVARRILAWAKRMGKTEFTERDCWLGVRRQGEDLDTIKKPLTLLCDYAWLRPVALPERDDPAKGGRPKSPKYQVNPLLPERQDDKGHHKGCEGCEGSERASRPEENASHQSEDEGFKVGMPSQNPHNPQNSPSNPIFPRATAPIGRPIDPWDGTWDEEEEGDLVS